MAAALGFGGAAAAALPRRGCPCTARARLGLAVEARGKMARSSQGVDVRLGFLPKDNVAQVSCGARRVRHEGAALDPDAGGRNDRAIGEA